MSQLKLDFSKSALRVPDGKKMQRIGIACSDDFKSLFHQVCRLRGRTESEVGFQYLLEGVRKDIADIFMPEPHLDKSLRESIKEFG